MATKRTGAAGEAQATGLGADPTLDDQAVETGSARLVERAAVEGDRREAIPIVEETLRVGKEEVLGGRVRVRTVTETVQETAEAALQSERVEVTRVPVGRMVDEAPAVRTEGDLMIVPVLEEVLVVEKRLHLKEELHIRRRVETETFSEQVPVRRQRAVVERLDDAGAATEVEIERDAAAKRQV